MERWRQHKTQILARLGRAEGQVRAVAAMVEREDSCERIAQQLTAARRALDRAFFDLVACSLERQLGQIKGLETAQARIQETAAVLSRYG